MDGNSQIRTGDLVQNYLDATGKSCTEGVADSCAPNTVTVYNTPTRYFEYVNHDLGIYAQDTWTMKRLTLSPGVRFDMFNAKSQGGCRDAGRFAPAFCRDDVQDQPNWNDIVAAHGGGVRPVRQREDRAQGAASASTCCRGPAAGPSATTRSRPSPTRATGAT